MDFGMPYLIETATQKECIALCKRLGLKFIEWNMNFPQCQLEELDSEWLREIGRREGIYFTLHLDENLNISDFNPLVRQAYMETALKAIELARRIGAPVINMHLAKGIYITLPHERRYLFEEYGEFYYRNMEEFRDACETATGDSGMKIAVENTDGFQGYERKAIDLLLESKCFGLTLDIGHSHVAGNRDIPFFEDRMERLIHMHAHDATPTHNHLAFGDGEIDLGQRLNMAQAAGSRVVLETKTVDALERTVQYIRSKFPALLA